VKVRLQGGRGKKIFSYSDGEGLTQDGSRTGEGAGNCSV